LFFVFYLNKSENFLAGLIVLPVLSSIVGARHISNHNQSDVKMNPIANPNII